MLSNEEIEEFRNFDIIINERIKKDYPLIEFTFKCKDTLIEHFESMEILHFNSSYGIENYGLNFSKNGIIFLNSAMKLMLSPNVYQNFVKGINFYNNYVHLMNISDYDSSILMECVIRKKDQTLQGKIFNFTLYGKIEVDIVLPTDTPNRYREKSRETFFEIKKRDFVTGDVYDLVKTNDLSEFYQYLFDTYSGSISDILNKPVSEMTLDDGLVLMMVNI